MTDSQKRSQETTILPTEQKSWTVDGLTIAGQIFGPADGIPILALHGWLDNSASFECLAQAMPDFRIVAIDMIGHGLSDHRSPDATYQIWDDLPQLIGLIDQLGWDKCVLLGHSRGGMIAALLASVIPERVIGLITLDAMLPLPIEDSEMITQFRSFLRDRKKYSGQAGRVFASEQEYVERRTRAGEPQEIARKLAARALRKTDDGFEWRGDRRLSGASALKLNRGQNEALLHALTMPVLNIWASPSKRMERLTNEARVLAATHIADLTVRDVAGHHHWHMEGEPARQIAAEIVAFLSEKV